MSSISRLLLIGSSVGRKASPDAMIDVFRIGVRRFDSVRQKLARGYSTVARG
jgi:hypothetical protein